MPLALIFFYFLTTGLIMLLGEGFETGKLVARGGYIERNKNPNIFWCFVIFYILVAMAFTLLPIIFIVDTALAVE